MRQGHLWGSVSHVEAASRDLRWFPGEGLFLHVLLLGIKYGYVKASQASQAFNLFLMLFYLMLLFSIYIIGYSVNTNYGTHL